MVGPNESEIIGGVLSRSWPDRTITDGSVDGSIRTGVSQPSIKSEMVSIPVLCDLGLALQAMVQPGVLDHLRVLLDPRLYQTEVPTAPAFPALSCGGSRSSLMPPLWWYQMTLGSRTQSQRMRMWSLIMRLRIRMKRPPKPHPPTTLIQFRGPT